MKKSFIAAGALALGVMFAQNVQAQGITVGPKVGLNISHFGFTGDNDDAIEESEEDRESTFGVQAGAVVNIGVNEMFSIQPEVLFSQKGVKYKGEDDEFGEYEETTTINYIEIPVLAKVSFGSDDVKFFVNAGPYAAFALGGNTKYEAGGEELEEDIEFDFVDDEESVYSIQHAKRFDYGLAVGAGVGFKLGSGMLNVEARYSYGLNDITEYQSDYKDLVEALAGEIPKTSNRTIGISVSYMFGLGN